LANLFLPEYALIAIDRTLNPSGLGLPRKHLLPHET
jgi:hypothetical protein